MTKTPSSDRALSLRKMLQRGTHDLHNRLDASLGSASLAADGDYAAFLGVQYAARAGIEAWARSNMGDMCPPLTADLVARDLAALSVALPQPQPFAMPHNAAPLGVAWALGGSALGNKALLVRRRRAGACHAEAFLSDDRTARYFRALLPHLERPAAPGEAAATVEGARAVFQSFLGAMRLNPLQAAA